MSFRLVSLIIVSILGTTVFAQDTLKVGINDQLIQVEAPKNNQKVTVLIEDTTFTYKVEISKLENNSILNQKIESSEANKNKWSRKKHNFSSSWFNSYEVGFNTLAFKNINSANDVFNINLDSASSNLKKEYPYRSFAKTGQYWGMYFDFTIRDKKRKIKNMDKYYARRKSHVRFDYNSTKGKIYKSLYYGGGDVNQDSLISETAINHKVSISYLQLSQLFAYGWNINNEKNISLEYGINLGLQAKIKVASSDNNSNIIDETASYLNVLSSFVSTPWIRVQHHLALNYDKYSLNVKSTLSKNRFGNINRKNTRANVVSVGFGYTF